LAADSGPAAGFEVRQEFGKVALIFGGSDKASDGMALAGAGAAPVRFDSAALAARHAHGGGPHAAAPEIYLQRPLAIKSSQGADPVANPSEQYRELGPAGYAVLVLQLGGREELHADLPGRRSHWRQFQGGGLKRIGDQLGGAVVENLFGSTGRGDAADTL
jgi:hypothetical protein